MGVLNFYCIPQTICLCFAFFCMLCEKNNVYLRFQIFVSNVQTFPSGFNPGAGGGTPHMKGVGMLVGNSELDP